MPTTSQGAKPTNYAILWSRHLDFGLWFNLITVQVHRAPSVREMDGRKEISGQSWWWEKRPVEGLANHWAEGPGWRRGEWCFKTSWIRTREIRAHQTEKLNVMPSTNCIAGASISNQQQENGIIYYHAPCEKVQVAEQPVDLSVMEGNFLSVVASFHLNS